MGRRPERVPEAAYRVLLDRETLVGFSGGYLAAEAVDVMPEHRAVLAEDHHLDVVEADRQVGEILVARMLGEPGRRRDLAPLAGCHASVVGHALAGAVGSVRQCAFKADGARGTACKEGGRIGLGMAVFGCGLSKLSAYERRVREVGGAPRRWGSLARQARLVRA